MLRTALTSLRYRTARLVLSCLAIGLGVAFVSGTLVFTSTLSDATQAASDSVSAPQTSPSLYLATAVRCLFAASR